MKRFLPLIAALPAATHAQSAADTDPRGLTLALTGVLIVFAGLAAISLFITLLPRVLAAFKHKPKTPEPSFVKPVPRDSVGGLDTETLAAIAMVVRAESERVAGSNLKVTLGFNTSPWALSSHMRILPGRISS